MATVPIDPKDMRGMLPMAGQGAAHAGGAANGPSFVDTLRGYINEVNELQQESTKALAGLATGKVDNLHEVLVAMSEADLSFRLMMEIRNKLLEAYREITRMQV